MSKIESINKINVAEKTILSRKFFMSKNPVIVRANGI
jgi:hypothetical protein